MVSEPNTPSARVGLARPVRFLLLLAQLLGFALDFLQRWLSIGQTMV